MAFYLPSDINDTIVALSTPPGIGAIGIIRLSGNESITICNKLFFGSNLEHQISHTIHFGTIRDGSEIIDEVLVSLFISPKSYTKEDLIEISCHGSPYILQKILQLCLDNGARLAKAGEFTMRAFLNGRMDLSQAEAVADLIASETASAHKLAMKQMRGGISDEISQLRQQLINFASLIELELDFSEEDVEFADRSALINLIIEIKALLEKLMISFQLGNAIKNGISTVIAGRPNAGKSTLLNALLNEERAIVSEIAGTTRDTIEEVVNINGVPFRMIDTAGIRAAKDAIEAIGVQKTFEKIEQSAMIVYVFDPTEISLEDAETDVHQIVEKNNVPLLVLANKTDLLKDENLLEIKQWGLQKFAQNFISLSALKKDETQYLKDLLYQSLIKKDVAQESVLVSNVRHFDALKKSNDALANVLNGVESNISGELLSIDIRQALHYLGEITGEVTTDDLLGNIFSKFCIGK